MNVRRYSLILALGLLTAGGAAWADPSFSFAFTGSRVGELAYPSPAQGLVDLYSSNKQVEFPGIITNTSGHWDVDGTTWVPESLQVNEIEGGLSLISYAGLELWAAGGESGTDALFSFSSPTPATPTLLAAGATRAALFTIIFDAVAPQTAQVYGEVYVNIRYGAEFSADWFTGTPTDTFMVDLIPEPASLALLGLGLLGLIRRPRKALR